MLVRITVAQHIFASLTREQSPARRRGYQTLFYTRGQLDSATVRAIEDRAQHRVTQGEKDKWQFFWLTGNQGVISRLVAVPEPDEFGRKGRYLAHSLIISAADWRALNYSPFELMRTASFCRTMDQALALGDLKTGELRAASLEISSARHERAREIASQWSSDELWKLARLTCHAYAITRGGQFVAVIGDSRQINDALDVSFLLPPPPRTDCSFDTSAGGCAWSRDVSFWGQGFAEEREARTPFVVHAAQRKVRLPPDWQPPHTPYERWLNFMISTRQFSSLQRDQGDASVLSESLGGRANAQDEMRRITSSVKRDFAEANQAQVEERIASLLPEQFPGYLRDPVLIKIGRTPQARLEWLVKNPAGEGLGDILFDLFREWEEPLDAKVMRSLLTLADAHPGLHLLFAVWSGDEKEMQRSLSAMTAAQYGKYVQKLRSRASCERWHFFSAKHLHAWFRIFDQRITLKDVFEGIALIAKYGSESELDALCGITTEIISLRQHEIILEWITEQSFRKRIKRLQSSLEQSVRAESETRSDNPISFLGRIIKRNERR